MKNIIIIEDTNFIRMHMIAILQQNPSYNVIGFGDAETIAINPHVFLNDTDLIITDRSLPGMSGIELTRMLNQHPKFKNIPVIVASTNNEIKTINASIMAGAVDYIVKPFDDKLLLQKVSKILEKPETLTNKHEAFAADRIQKIVAMEFERARRGKTYLSIMKLEVRPMYIDYCIKELLEKTRRIDTVFGFEHSIIIVLPLTDPKGMTTVLQKIRKTVLQYNMKILENNLATYIPGAPNNDKFEAMIKTLTN